MNRLCAQAVTETERVIAGAFARLEARGGLPDDPTPADLQAFYAAILPAARDAQRVIDGLLEHVRALGAPGELADEAGELWDAYEKRTEASVERIVDAVSDPDAAVALDVDDTFPFAPENERATALGFTECAFR